MKRTLLIAAAPALMAGALLFSATAGAVMVSEPPDLGNNDDGDTITEVTLDLGINTVSGSAFLESGDNPDREIDFDDFILTVQPNHELVSASFEWTLISGVGANTQYRLFDGIVADPNGPTDLSGLAVVPLGTAPTGGATGMFEAVLSLFAGQYLLDHVAIGFIGNDNADFDYTWTFNVAVVPLPPAAWLFISGLLVMVGFSRRQRVT